MTTRTLHFPWLAVPLFSPLPCLMHSISRRYSHIVIMQILQQMNAVQVQLSSVKVLHAFLLPESAAALEKQRTKRRKDLFMEIING
jgi:hypothetical protein